MNKKPEDVQDTGREGRALTPSRLAFVLTASITLVADMVTKYIISSTFYLHEIRQVIGDYGRLTYIHNPGAAFGLFPGSRFALIVISLAAVVVVIVVAWNRKNGIRTVMPLGLILGGAVGNLIDRIRLGEVVDFIQIGIPPQTYWPVFNVADSAVTIGVSWLALGLVMSGRGDSASEAEEQDAGGEAGTGTGAGAEDHPIESSSLDR